MQLHMLNWQRFRCLNIAQPGLRHEFLIIQFANIFPGCQRHFAKEKKAQHKKHELLFTGKGTESGNLFHVTLKISKSIWQFLQTFNCCTQKPPWSFADWGIMSGADAERAIHHAAECKPRYWELSSRPPSEHVGAEEKLLRAIWLWEGVCKLSSESLNSVWLFYLSAAAAAHSPWKHVLAVENKNYCWYPFCSLERGHLYFVLWSRTTVLTSGTSQHWKSDF